MKLYVTRSRCHSRLSLGYATYCETDEFQYLFFSKRESQIYCRLEQNAGENQSTESVPKKYKLKTLEYFRINQTNFVSLHLKIYKKWEKEIEKQKKVK